MQRHAAMEFEDFGARFSVAVEDFSGSWSLLQEVRQVEVPAVEGSLGVIHTCQVPSTALSSTVSALFPYVLLGSPRIER